MEHSEKERSNFDTRRRQISSNGHILIDVIIVKP